MAVERSPMMLDILLLMLVYAARGLYKGSPTQGLWAAVLALLLLAVRLAVALAAHRREARRARAEQRRRGEGDEPPAPRS